MADFLLVHGAMHGGWCWNPVADRLRSRGHRVVAPALTGQGERRHLLTRDVGVSTHVTDLVNCVGFEGLTDVAVVLHSYAGVLAGPLVEALTGTVSSVVAAGAFLTDPGECLLDVEPAATAARYREIAEGSGDGWRVPASDAFLDQWGVTDPALRAFVGPRLTDFPLRCATDATDYDPATLASVRRLYIEHTAPPLDSLAASIDRARVQGWTTTTIATGHDMMLTAPDQVAAMLHDWAPGA